MSNEAASVIFILAATFGPFIALWFSCLREPPFVD
jgi:hypothetical protein